MKQITCYIRFNRSRINSDILPYTMETYPNKGKLQRRDFDCISTAEAKKIAHAVYGKKAKIVF